MADHRVLIGRVRRVGRILAHENAINAIKLYVFLYVHVGLPCRLPPLELAGKGYVL